MAELKLDVTAPAEKLLTRVIDCFEKFAGGLTKPWQMRRTASAEVDVARARAEMRRLDALVDAETEQLVARVRRGDNSAAQVLLASPGTQPLLTSGKSSTERHRIEPRLLDEVTKPSDVFHLADLDQRLCNIEKYLKFRSVCRMTEEEAESSSDDDFEEGEVERDWFDQWRLGAEQVSNKELQRLWARLLCQEMQSPGAFSLRTIQTLRTLGKEDALLLSKLAPLALNGIVLKPNNDTLKKRGINVSDLMELQALGLLVGAEGGYTLTMTAGSINEEKWAISAIIKRDQPASLFWVTFSKPYETRIPSLKLSTVGEQIIRLGKFYIDEAYLREIATLLASGAPDAFVDASVLHGEFDTAGNFSTRYTQAISVTL